jgi:penicillin-binding protein 2
MTRFRRQPLATEQNQAFTFTRRAVLLGAAEGGVGLLLAGRMGYLAITQNELYEGKAEENRVQARLIPPQRGWITDRNGKPIAINQAAFRVDIIPEQLRDPDRIIAELTRLLALPPEEVQRIREELAHAQGLEPVPVAELSRDQYDLYAAVKLRQPELPGVSPLESFARFYPLGAGVGQLVGYVGTPSREEYQAEDRNPLLLTPGFKIGKSGLEKTMELQLRGTPGQARMEVTARGRLVRELTTLPDRRGAPLKTTIDADLQEYAARRIGDQSAAVVVLDCNNGDILALASMPSFDPNAFSDGISHAEWDMMAQDERHPLINKVLQGLYPPGSTCKPMNALALLQAGISPDAHVVCNGSYPVGNAVFHCDKHHGSLSMRGAVAHSCDIYFYHMARQAGVAALAPMMHHLGYGERFDLPFPSQRYGTVPDPDWLRRRENRDWQEYDTINMSIGQGYMLVNPMQQAVQVARLASGRMIAPRLIVNPEAPAPAPLDVPPDRLAFIRAAMSDVINAGGTAPIARLPVANVQMAGKTGTAQVRRISMAERQSGGVRTNESLAWRMRDHSWFVCFAPVDQPRYAACFFVEHGGFGASAAAPLARDVMTFLFDRDVAMQALNAMEAQWGGNLQERTARAAQRWAAGQGEPVPPGGGAAIQGD